MKRTIAGIPFLIHSPCHYEVAARDDGSAIATAHLRFDGEWWTLAVELKAGHTVTRDFRSLTEALALLSSRAAA